MRAGYNMSEDTRYIPEKRPNNYGIENALAGYVRRRWRKMTVAFVRQEWGLSDGQARSVVYGTTSLRALNAIIKHKRGGWPLLLEIAADALGTSLEHHLSEREARDTAKRNHTARLASLLRGCGPDHDGLDHRPDGDGSGHA